MLDGRILEHTDSDMANRISTQMFDEFQQQLASFQESWNSRKQPEKYSRVFELNRILKLVLFSDQIESLLGSSIDCLEQFTPYIQRTIPLPTVAHYSMLRSAIDTSSTALWLLNITRKNKQSWASLRITYHDNQQMIDLAKQFNVDDSLFIARKREILEIQKSIRDYSKHDISRRAHSIDIIRSADSSFRSRGIDSLKGETVWDLCSGFIHGNRSILPFFSETRFQGYSDTGFRYELTTSLLPVAQSLRTIMSNCDMCLEKYNELCLSKNR